MYVREFIKKIGGLSHIAIEMGISEQAISKWYKAGVSSAKSSQLAKYCKSNGWAEFNKRFISELERE
jgi:DNA-binding phage protein